MIQTPCNAVVLFFSHFGGLFAVVHPFISKSSKSKWRDEVHCARAADVNSNSECPRRSSKAAFVLGFSDLVKDLRIILAF